MTTQNLSVLAAAAAVLLVVTESALAGGHDGGSGSGASTTNAPISQGPLHPPSANPNPVPVTKGNPGGHGLPPGSTSPRPGGGGNGGRPGT